MVRRPDPTKKIKDPAQRVLALRMSEICDIFSERFAVLDNVDRLSAKTGRAEDRGDRVRNNLRMLALGCAVKLGTDLGCSAHALHGRGDSAATEVAELSSLHYATTHEARMLFEALMEDGGEFGRWVAERYKALVEAATLDLAAARRPKSSRGPLRIRVTAPE